MKKKKILISGGYPHHLMEGIGEEFSIRNWDVEYFDASPESPWHRPLIKPIRKLIHNLRIKRHPETFDNSAISNLGWRSRRWLKAIKIHSPDMALILRGNRFAYPWLREAMDHVPHAVWYLEPPSRMKTFIEEIKKGSYKKICSYSYSLAEKINEEGFPCHFFPHKSPLKMRGDQLSNSNRTYDWVFWEATLHGGRNYLGLY